MTDLKVNDLEAGKTYCAKRHGAATWSLFGTIDDKGNGDKYYKSYNSEKKLENLDGVSFKEQTPGVACDNVNITGGSKKKSLKANKKKKKSLKANKNKKKSLKANKNKKKSLKR